MKCIAWLGNPGPEYAKTRHNAGFLAIETLRERWGFPEFAPSKYKGLVSEGMRNGEKVLLVKPLTYMNLSGQCVGPIVSFYKMDPKSDLLVLSDDIDLDFWMVRYRTKGSAGWQNGLKSIIASVGSEDFARIKIGIWRDSRYVVSDWVLSQFTTEELSRMNEEVIPKSLEMAVEWMRS